MNMPLKSAARLLCGLLPFVLSSCDTDQPPKNDPSSGAPPPPSAIEAIRQEATKKAVNPEGWPLPLASTWNTGEYYFTWPDRPRGADGAWQLEQIAKGHRFLPTFIHPMPNFDEAKFSEALYPPFERVRDARLPFVLLASQWERFLTTDEKYFLLPPEQNPNVVTPDGEVLKKVDPFGPTEAWYEVGKFITSESPALRKLQGIYPDPPRVIFLSNNEHGKLSWHEAETSRHYLEKYGTGKSDQFKQKVFGDAWIEKYRALQKGMRDGLSSAGWKKAAIFIGYGGDVGMEAMGRWGGWVQHSLLTPGRPSIAPFEWDGVSPSYYMHNWSPVSDYQVLGNQVEAMNSVFAMKKAFEINPDFWFELSIWDGDEPNEHTGDKPKLTVYREAGQVYDMERYRGWLQYGLWLLRPRALRLFEGWTVPLEAFQEKFENLMLVTDRVHENSTLRKFWRKGELVPNSAQQHPYQINIPNEIAIQPRWFLLDADVNPPRPWELTTEIPVFSLAYKLGEAPKRSWLVYAHAPLRDYQNVKITIPDYQSISIPVPREGVFYEVAEADGSVKKVDVRAPRHEKSPSKE